MRPCILSFRKFLRSWHPVTMSIALFSRSSTPPCSGLTLLLLRVRERNNEHGHGSTSTIWSSAVGVVGEIWKLWQTADVAERCERNSPTLFGS